MEQPRRWFPPPVTGHRTLLLYRAEFILHIMRLLQPAVVPEARRAAPSRCHMWQWWQMWAVSGISWPHHRHSFILPSKKRLHGSYSIARGC